MKNNNEFIRFTIDGSGLSFAHFVPRTAICFGPVSTARPLTPEERAVREAEREVERIEEEKREAEKRAMADVYHELWAADNPKFAAFLRDLSELSQRHGVGIEGFDDEFYAARLFEFDGHGHYQSHPECDYPYSRQDNEDHVRWVED